MEYGSITLTKTQKRGLQDKCEWKRKNVLCSKNIKTFLTAYGEVFQMRKGELFRGLDLFDVRDFRKDVIQDTISTSRCHVSLDSSWL
ncbi:guanine nucleotide exchange factor VAV3-like [Camelus dromedarius]|uniref:guanine nucleotide exchange factor VAV3-like n=1 Tax=Camelus dromedarius TaxID=9838 RepID=UPI003119E8EE